MPCCMINANDTFYELRKAENPEASVVFIHGSGGEHWCWQEQLHGLAAAIITVAPDLPGHGQSTGSACESIARAASFAVDFLAEMALPRPIYLAGHSMGAAIALHAAKHYPDSLDGIILIGGGSRMRVMPAMLEGLARGEADPDFLRAAFAPDSDRQLVENYLVQAGKVPATLLYTDFNACDKFDMTAELETIKKPALIIAGEKDLLTPVKYSRRLYEKLPSSRLKIIADAGHFVMLEKPDEVNRAIEEFVL